MTAYASKRRTALTVAGVLLVSLATPACGIFDPPSHQAKSNPTPVTPATPVTVALTPGDGAKNVPISSEIGLKVGGGRVNAISLVTARGARPVAGAMRDDGTSWVPAAPLAYATGYAATVTAANADGTVSQTSTTRFTTMPRPNRQTSTGLYMQSGQTYGVALPVVIEFDPPVADGSRASVQRRLFVRSNPPQPGVWHWTGGNQILYRPPRYWKPGTTITVRAALAGQPMGGGYYGDVDRSATARITNSKTYLEISNKTKQMKVFVKDKLVRTVPVSLGKSSTPSSSGHMVVMSHDYSTLFDTTREGPGGYRVWVNYAMRLTWGGEFIHAAPWSEGDQGYRNVSHGCVNISWSNAKWLFGVARVGDPVVVKGTGIDLPDGNGWTAWNQTWASYIKGSALPVPPALARG